MTASGSARGLRDRHPYRLYGVLFLAAVAAFVAVCFLALAQVFTPAAYVTLRIPRAGQQLLPGSDVKVRGIVVGSVESISSTGNGATIRLRLQPSALAELPTNVTAQLVPKTLFGEKYVNLLLPSRPAGAHLTSGSVIAEDATKPTMEIDQALNDLLPVLRTVRPQDLNSTLSAVATALQGRGGELGQTMVQLDGYLRAMNPHLPRLQHDLASLTTTARTYDQAAGPLLDTLANLTVTSGTIIQEQRQLRGLLDDVTGASGTLRQFLASNAGNLIAVNTVNKPMIDLLRRYSPELDCFLVGDAKLAARIHTARITNNPLLAGSAHVKIEFVPAFPTYQYPKDLPEFGDTRGPSCYGLPNPPIRLPVVHYKDGLQDDPRFANQGQPGPLGGGSGSGSGSGRAAGTTHVARPASAVSPDMGAAGTAAERAAFDNLLAPLLRLPAAQVPDIADLLWGPLARGNGVRLVASGATP